MKKIHILAGWIFLVTVTGCNDDLLESTPYELAISVHPHPTVSEVIGEAAHDLLGHAIHI